MTGERILTVNAGSSSIRVGLFSGHPKQEKPTPLARGKLDGIGIRPRLQVVQADGSSLAERTFPPAQVADMRAAFRLLEVTLGNDLRGERPVLVSHRVVHGGALFSAPMRVSPALLARLHTLESLAPLHQPYNLAPIQALLDTMPELPQVVCFDTAFHTGRSELSQLFALPYALYEQGIRRYGFHGLSFEYVSRRLAEVAPEITDGKVVIAHLGNGSSLCGVESGRSVEVTTSFSTLDGLPMGSRCGALDPGVLLHMLAGGETADNLEELLYRRSGLLGISGVSSDMLTLRASQESRAKLAIDHYVYRIAQEVGRLAASLGGLDALVFTAGIGEKDAELRAQVVDRLAPLFDLRLDADANRRHATRISSANSARPLLVIATDEESMLAEHAWRLYREDAL
ncbi:acetate/propionate family kinase [Pseudomonas aeruginosa]|uniref:acetate/propionate family kinase n=1 Tax=Pseudomonas aeruginosa TaxID=287 RepID=UPI0022386D52|nr:acetate/propionate family kinase [Pseudomonas aeruginosa]MCW4646450.1 acetate/propionate family kinase [Pseudomonas aeruginosa]